MVMFLDYETKKREMCKACPESASLILVLVAVVMVF